MLALRLVLALAWALSVHASLYTKSSPVLQLDAKTYDSLIAQSNHTSIVEFYAPWCGHCKNLQPAYEKAAKSLTGLAKVAAIDCDDEANKAFCGQMGVQGFPTLKIVRPGSKQGRPAVEDYNGPRTAKGIVEAVKDKISSHVTKLQGSALDKWVESVPTKAIIFTEKGTTGPMIKSLAIDFLGTIHFAQVKDKATAEKYGVSKFPSVLLIPSAGAESITYEGEINRESLIAFFSQVATPNPDPAPKDAKAAKSSSKRSKSKPSSSASAAFSKASEAHKSSEFEDHLAGSSTIVLDDVPPTESPLPIVEPEQKPMVVEDVITPLPTLSTSAEVESACLSPKSGNCILVLLPQFSEDTSQHATSALAGFAEITAKHTKRKANVIPMYAVDAHNPAAIQLRTDLGLGAGDKLEIIATNMKRGWWKQYQSETYDAFALENFIDAIKLGEGSKSKLPAGFVVNSTGSTESVAAETPDTVHTTDDIPQPEPEVTPAVEASDDSTSGVAEPEPLETPVADHDEL